jgi:hypothetical protein
MKGEARARDGLGPNMDSTTSDTDDSYYVGELIRKQSITAMSVFGAAEAKETCETNPADASNPDAAAAAERENDSRNSEANEVTAQTRESPQLYPPSISPYRDALTLAQLYHPSRRGSRHNCHDSTSPRWKHPSSLPKSQGNAFEDDAPGMIGTPAADDTLTLTLAQLHHPSACSTVSSSMLSSKEAEQIWQDIQDHIGNIADDDWSFNGSPPSTESEEVIIPVRVDEDAADRDRKRTKTSHKE